MSKLILVHKSDGEQKNFSLDVSAMLSACRTVLAGKSFMADADFFLNQNAVVDRSDEAQVALSDLVGEDGKQPLQIGSPTADLGREDADQSLQRYDRMSATDKLALMTNLQIYKGLTATGNSDFSKTYEDCLVAWTEQTLPNFVKPRHITEVTTEYSFNEVAQKITTTNVDKGSVSLTTPYGGGNSSFEYARSHSTASDKVTEYLCGKFIVRKVSLDVDLKNLKLRDDFEQDILNAVKSGDTDIDRCANLINVLNKRGYYVAKSFTLGGLLYSTATTQISEFSEADSEKTDFSVGFKVEFDGIGGGGDYSHSEGRDTSNSTTSKYKNLSLTQVGGRPGTQDKYDDWITSLNPSENWDVAGYDALYPTLALLSDGALRSYCLKLIDKYATYDSIKGRQTVIDISGYATSVETILSSGSGGFEN